MIDLGQAVTYVVAEGSGVTNFATDVLPKLSADVVVRGWFKWHDAPPVASWRGQAAAAHKLGAIFGGGVTCSALYDGENGLTDAQVAEMATRDPQGNLVDAWGQKGIRHGSLSNPRYRDYLLRWCKEQLDAGADYLFMDEPDAALGPKEGFDDASLNDFRDYLRRVYAWNDRDPRWLARFGIDLDDPEVCPTRGMDSFNYRAYLRKTRHIDDPTSANNPFQAAWGDFKKDRDDRVWRELLKGVRSYGESEDRKIYVSGNGLYPDVDLQVLGVWNHWTTLGGHVDLSDDQIPVWRSIVEQGQEIAGRPVPVVLFHDWGFGNPPFPFMAVPLTEREVWLRTRAAEIYAAGGYFAFPVLGPGCDASKDGTLPLISELTKFYRSQRSVFLGQRYLGRNGIVSNLTGLSLAATWLSDGRTLAVHVVNRNVKDGALVPLHGVKVWLPVGVLPAAISVASPDGGGSATVAADGGRTLVELQSLNAYSIALLRYDSPIDLSVFHDAPRYFLNPRWERPARSEFVVSADGRIDHEADLEGFLQGRLHTDLHNPPVFLVDFPRTEHLRVHIRAVATQGANVQVTVGGGDSRSAFLPDKDGKNDPGANEYDVVLDCPIPPGPHRVWLDNIGPDWAVIDWLEFSP